MKKLIKKFLIIIYIIILIKLFKNKYNFNFINIKGQINKNKIFYILNNKKIINIKMFKKNYLIFFFGYSLCINICPKILNNLKNKIKNLKNFYKIKFIFFSINWKNENNEITQKYLNKLKIKNFYGISGSGKKIELISKIFRIIYKYNKKNNINHSSVIYILNKNFKTIFLEINKKKKNFLKNIKN